MWSKNTALLFSIICMLFVGCKKDNNSQQPVVTFNLNSTATTFNIYTSTLSTTDTLGVQEKILTLASPGVISGPAVSSGIVFGVIQNVTLPGLDSLRLGTYTDAQLDSSCQGNGYMQGCSGFFLLYYNPTIGSVSPSKTDTMGYVNITALSATNNLISGTFQCQVTDTAGNHYQITNGRFTNVPFVSQ